MKPNLKRKIELFLFAILSALALLAAGAVYSWYYYNQPGPLAQRTTVVFQRGEGFIAIVDDMAAHGVIRHPLLFKIIAVLSHDARSFKAGEYDFSATISPRLIMDMISEGRVVVHKITVPEGLTARDVLQMVKNEPDLDGVVPESVKEGSLLPETYHYVYGDKREDLIARMQLGMKQTLATLWEKRDPNLPYETPEQAVTMASIIEKETGLAAERPHVASVFVNRLRLGMKLQSDPTVTYGLVQQGGPMDHALVSSDLRTPTPYNTYVIPGLPPGPIANPGRASLEAALHPLDTKDLYFVATGNGGHNFSGSLEGHNHNVQQYHKALAQKDTPKKEPAKKEPAKKEPVKKAPAKKAKS